MGNDFDQWNRIKKATDAADDAARLYFREGEVWRVRLGKNIGYETDGKNLEFTGPAHYDFVAGEFHSTRKFFRRSPRIPLFRWLVVHFTTSILNDGLRQTTKCSGSETATAE